MDGAVHKIRVRGCWGMPVWHLNVVRVRSGRRTCMRRVGGLALFFTGIGMVIALIAPKGLIMVLIAAICLLAGYNLFCCP